MDDCGSNFAQWKNQCLAKMDLSKKGSIDEDIQDVVRFINLSENFFTTSSCSGRIILIDGASDCQDVQKQNCSWLFVTHQMCHKCDVVSGLERSQGDAVFKFEPFVLHVQCKQLQDAQLLHSLAINSGFRNSGITIGKKGKIMMAVRSTHTLEVPVSHKGQQLVDDHYIDFLVEVANQKMQENLRRIKRFYDSLKSAMHPEKLHSEMPDVAEKKSVYKRRRKRAQERSKAALCQNIKENTSSGESDGLDSGLDLFK
ncbi:tRNA wybutosine-synthesizing protein 3 homolog [Scleropages formosus]|uniref:tRNA wybutosine-synthesizing protein 3 homolog n=1 Tax=Scleropages formosus TaxID=113540 RepID=A0A8C9VMU8_SCLFO|nr:tRNA wybutosine-synthesizing protein 3 homolog [Scleropages formosus]